MSLPHLARRARGALQSFFQLPAGGVATPATLLAGLRAATATVVPIVVAGLTGQAALVWAALGGWLSSFADTGGAYRTRARSMAWFALGGAVSCAAGALVGRSPWLAVPLVFVWAAGGAMLRLYGDAAASVGSLLAVTFVASLGAPTDPADAAARGALFAAGCAWAMVLALAVWPLRPWQPARRAVAECYAALAGYARGIARALVEAPRGGQAWHALALREHAHLRATLESARAVLGETRRSRAGSSRRGEDLVVLLESADLLFEALVAASEAVELAARAAADDDGSPIPAALHRAVSAVADLLDGLAAHIPIFTRWRGDPMLGAHGADRAVLALWAAADAAAHGASGERASADGAAHVLQAAALLEHAATLAETSVDAVRSLLGAAEDDEREAPVAARAAASSGAPRPGALAVLAANLTPDSLVLRHAMRLGAVAAVSTWVVTRFHLPHATWVTTTALIVLQPYAGLTRRRGLERLTGTVLGGVVAALLAAVLHDRLLIAAIMFPLSLASIAVRAAHYGLFTFFLTPVFVLLAEPAAGDWPLAGVRILDTLIGGALAMAANELLWPSWEHRRLPADLAAMVDAVRAYFRAVEWRALGGDPRSAASLGAARRRLGLASNNVDAAIQRFVAEPRGPIGDVESLMTMLTFVRRVAGALTVLAVGASTVRPSSAEHEALARALDAVLADVADALRAERAPAPLPDVVARLARSRGEGGSRDGRALRTTLELPALGMGLDRVARQVAVLHTAATRVFGRSRAAA